jgi:WD40 repeat protein
MEEPKYQFDVFLSYSRKDEEFGKRLEEALESYTLPKAVSARALSTKRLNVFRDKKDLVPTDSDYYKSIEGYLKLSRYLIVVCSPNARSSEYVNQEIRAYLQSHKANQIIAVLLSGKPNNDTEARPEDYAFPQALCDAMAMPLAVAFTDFERAPGRLNKGRFHDSWYTLLSKIFGTERAEIERLDAKRQARRRAIFAAVSLAVIAVLSVALVFAIISRQQAASERDHAEQLLYVSDMNLAQRAFDSGNIGLGRELLESHRPKSGERDLRGFEWYYLWRLYNGHIASFESTDDLAFSRDGSRFAIVTGGLIKIFETASRREIGNITLPNSSKDGTPFARSVDFSADGNTVAYGDDKRGTLLIEIASGSSRRIPFPVLGEKQKQSSVLSSEELIQKYWDLVGGGTPRFSPDGKLLAVDFGCGVVAVYDAKTLSQITTLGDGTPVSACTSFVTFSPDGKLLAYGNLYSVGLWDTVTHNDLPGPEMDVNKPDSIDQVESVAFSRDSRLLAIGDRSKQVVLWNISTRKVLARLKGHEGWVSALAFSPDGKTLYSGGIDQSVKLWDARQFKGGSPIDTENTRPFATLKGHSGAIGSIRCAANAPIIATVSADRTAKLWATTAGKEFETVDDVEAVFPQSRIALKTGNDKAITVFDFDAETRALPTKLERFPTVASPDSKFFASEFKCTEQSTCNVNLIEAGTRKSLTTMTAKSNSLSFSQNSRLFGVIGPDGKSVMLWDTVEKKNLPPINTSVELDYFLISAEGKALVTFDKTGDVESFDVESQHKIAQLVRNKKPGSTQDDDSNEQNPRALSPDGQLLAFSDSTKVEVWQVNSLDARPVLGNPDMAGRVSVIAFSGDGKLLAAGDDSGAVRIWNAVTRQELATFIGHRDKVTTLAFSADSRTLASGGDARDAAVKLYSMSAMRELLTLTHDPSPTSDTHAVQGSEDGIQDLFFSADGKALITYSGNLVLRIWRGTAPPSGPL